MQSIFISGNLGKDAELRQTQGGDDVLSFSVGVKQGYGDRSSTNWFRCNLWGKRARSLSDYLRKGVKVVVSGEFTIGDYQGKPQYEVRVGEVEFMSRADASGSGGNRADSGSRGGGGGSFEDDLNSDVPFMSCDPRHEHRVR